MTPIDAIYEGGVFRPLEDPGLVDGQQVTLVVTSSPRSPILHAFEGFYDGLSESEIEAIERIILDRR